MNNPLAGTDPTGYVSETFEFDPEKHKVLEDKKGNLYIDDGSDSVLKVDTVSTKSSSGRTVTQNFGTNGLSSASISNGNISLSVTDIGGPQQTAKLSVTNQTTGQEDAFNFTQAKDGDVVAGKGENILLSIADFLSGGDKRNWIYPPGHEVSERFKKHDAIVPYIKAYEKAGGWAEGENGERLIQDIRRQHTTYAKDFANDVFNILGAWGEGKPYHDYGTNAFGSFSIRGKMIFDKIKSAKSLDIEIFNRWSMSSLTRNPFTRKPMFNGGLNHVDVYVQISMRGKL